MEHSAYQINFLGRVRNGRRSIALQARAGSGKTTTIVDGAGEIDTDLKTVFVAFNKSIATKLQTMLPSNIPAKTSHSMGLRNIAYALDGQPKLDENKCRNIYRTMGGPRELEGTVLRLVSLGKSTDTKYPDFDYLAERFGVVIDDDASTVMEYVYRVFDTSWRDFQIIDFDDMVYLPGAGIVSCYRHDVLFVDEAQDLNPAQISMIKKSIKANGRVIAVGDEFQSIYGFRGADTEAMPRLIAELDAECLPLSICYRCGKSIIKLAQQIVPDIEWWDKSPEGEIVHTSMERSMKDIHFGDMILCRVNAPLVPVALQLIRKGVKAAIRGRDIGKQIGTLITKVRNRYATTNLASFLVAMNDYVTNEVGKLIAAEKTNAASVLQDQWETILALSDGALTVEDILNRVESIFSDDVMAVTLSSVHRAKGDEAETVYILQPELMPHPMAKTKWQMQQEMNLKYVAITRARNKLVFAN